MKMQFFCKNFCLFIDDGNGYVLGRDFVSAWSPDNSSLCYKFDLLSRLTEKRATVPQLKPLRQIYRRKEEIWKKRDYFSSWLPFLSNIPAQFSAKERSLQYREPEQEGWNNSSTLKQLQVQAKQKPRSGINTRKNWKYRKTRHKCRQQLCRNLFSVQEVCHNFCSISSKQQKSNKDWIRE